MAGPGNPHSVAVTKCYSACLTANYMNNMFVCGFSSGLVKHAG